MSDKTKSERKKKKEKEKKDKKEEKSFFTFKGKGDSKSSTKLGGDQSSPVVHVVPNQLAERSRHHFSLVNPPGQAVRAIHPSSTAEDTRTIANLQNPGYFLLPNQPYNSSHHSRSPEIVTPDNNAASGGTQQPSDIDRIHVPASSKPQTGPIIHSPSIAEELVRVELERDNYKREAIYMRTRLDDYEKEILQYRAQAKSSGASPDIKPSHDAQLIHVLNERDTCISQLMKEKTELQEEKTALQKENKKVAENIKEEVEMRCTVVEKEVRKEIQNEIEHLKKLLKEKEDQLLTATQKATSAETKANQSVNVVQKRLKEANEKYQKLEKEKEQQEANLAKVNEELQLEIARSQQANKEKEKWKEKANNLEREMNDKVKALQVRETKITHLKGKLQEQDTANIDVLGQLETMKEKKEELHRQFDELQRENDEVTTQSTKRVGELEEALKQKEIQQNHLEQQIVHLDKNNTKLKHDIKQLEEKYQENITLKVEETKQQIEKLCQYQISELQARAKTVENQLREEITILQNKVPLDTAEGASANNSLSEDDKVRGELELKILELEDTVKDYEESIVPKLHEQIFTTEAEQTEREEVLSTTHKEELAELQRKHDRKEKLIKDLNVQLKEMAALKEIKDKLSDGLAHKEIELDSIKEENKRLMKVKEEEIKKVKEERKATVSQMREQLNEQMKSVKNTEKEKKQLEKNLKQMEEDKLKQNTALVEQLQLKEAENAVFKADFESERNDRQKIHHQLTEKLEQLQTELLSVQDELAEANKKIEEAHKQAHSAKQALDDSTFSVEHLIERNKSLEEIVTKKEEEIEILTAQVNAHFERKEEINRALNKSEDKRNELETKITKLKATIDPLAETAERAKNQSEEIQYLRAQLKKSERQDGHDIVKLKEELAFSKQQLDSVNNSKESLLVAYEQEKGLANSLQNEVKDLKAMNDRLKNANTVLQQRMTKFMKMQANPNLSHATEGAQSYLYQPQQTYPISSKAQEPLTQQQSKNLAPRRNNTTSTTGPQYTTPEQVTHRPKNQQQQLVSGNAASGDSSQPAYSDPNDNVNVPPAFTQDEVSRLYGKERLHQVEIQRQQEAQWKKEEEERIRQIDIATKKENDRLREEADRALRELEEAKEAAKQSPKQSPKPFKKSKSKKEAPIEENLLIQNIDKEIQEAAQWVYDQSRRPPTAEVEAVSDEEEESTLPYDPNLICPKCGKRYHIGGIQLFKRHVTELCPLLDN